MAYRIIIDIFFRSSDDLGWNIFSEFIMGGLFACSISAVCAAIIAGVIDTILIYTIKKFYRDEIF